MCQSRSFRRNPAQAKEQESALPQASAEPGFFRRQALTLLQTPDAYWGWLRPAVHAGSRLIQQTRISAIFSSGPPWTSHLVARRLARKFHLPWLADFRDPWAGNPWAKNLPAWRGPLDKWLENTSIRPLNKIIGDPNPNWTGYPTFSRPSTNTSATSRGPTRTESTSSSRRTSRTASRPMSRTRTRRNTRTDKMPASNTTSRRPRGASCSTRSCCD